MASHKANHEANHEADRAVDHMTAQWERNQESEAEIPANDLAARAGLRLKYLLIPPVLKKGNQSRHP